MWHFKWVRIPSLTSPTSFGNDRTYFGYQVLCRTAPDVTMWWFWLDFFISLHFWSFVLWLLCFFPNSGCTLVGRGKDSEQECRVGVWYPALLGDGSHRMDTSLCTTLSLGE